MRTLGAVLLVAVSWPAGAADRPDLTGTIFDEAEKPLPGAVVCIYTAKPRTGPALVCPSCYLDCAKRSATDAKGGFSLSRLDPSLLFRVLVVAEGYEPLFIDDVDPGNGPVEAKLVALDPERLKPGHVLRGRVLDPQGKPVPGARVEPYARHSQNSTTYGRLGGVDALAATNEAGEFMITCAEPNLMLSLQIDARGHAPKKFLRLAAEDKVHELTLSRGATVMGKVVHNGKPVPGLLMGIVQTDRNSETFLGEIEIGTDEEGRFAFTNVPANESVVVYSQIVDPVVSHVVPVQRLRTGPDDGTVDVGTLETQPGHRLSGRVVLSDGKPVPAGTRVMISREVAWDWREVEVGEDGRIETESLPSEEYEIHCRVPGYRVSPKNYSLDPLNQNGLMGRIDEDTDDLTLLLEPGDWEWEQAPPEASQRYEKLKKEPIRGIE